MSLCQLGGLGANLSQSLSNFLMQAVAWLYSHGSLSKIVYEQGRYINGIVPARHAVRRTVHDAIRAQKLLRLVLVHDSGVQSAGSRSQ